jgi:putative acetyltransferase
VLAQACGGMGESWRSMGENHLSMGPDWNSFCVKRKTAQRICRGTGEVEAFSMEIMPAASDVQLEQVRSLLEEYWMTFGFPASFQNFAEEVAGLPGNYAPPAGRLALALIGDEPAGCAAFRQLDERRCEAKRLFVRPQFRGCGLGGALLAWLIAEAQHAGYAEMLGDTMPVMTRALEMYERLGFERTGPYAAEPTPGAIFLRLRLR